MPSYYFPFEITRINVFNELLTLISDISKDLMALLLSLKDMLVDKAVSANGRDNAISLIAKNVPRRDVRFSSNARTMKFLEIGGKRCDFIIDFTS